MPNERPRLVFGFEVYLAFPLVVQINVSGGGGCETRQGCLQWIIMPWEGWRGGSGKGEGGGCCAISAF